LLDDIGNTFIEENLQEERPSFLSVSWEKFSTATACSRVTVGKLARNSIKDSSSTHDLGVNINREAFDHFFINNQAHFLLSPLAF
jgi:hypothetical protein